MKKYNRYKTTKYSIEKHIKTHPVYIYFSAIILGMTTVFSMFAYSQKYLGFEIEKKGTYIYFKDYYTNIDKNYTPKIYYENILLENKILKEKLIEVDSRNTQVYLDQLSILNAELKKESDELIHFTTPMSINLKGENYSINTETEKYNIQKSNIDLIRKQIETLNNKL